MFDWEDYQKKYYGRSAKPMLIEFLKRHDIHNAIELGCGCGNDVVYMVKKGIKVLAIDKYLEEDLILDRLSDDEKKLVSLKKWNFEDLKLPKTELITAFFSIPFCDPKYYDELWNKIYDALEDNGFFICQLLGDKDDWNNIEGVNTFNLDEVKEYLKRYNVIGLRELFHYRKEDQKNWHFYNIIAQKK